MFIAGDFFRTMFRAAGLDQLHAQSFVATVDGTSRPDVIGQHDVAFRYISGALRRLGGVNSPAGSCVWFVLGEGYTIRDWGEKCGWSGRTMSETYASGVLLTALGVLAGLSREEAIENADAEFFRLTPTKI